MICPKRASVQYNCTSMQRNSHMHLGTSVHARRPHVKFDICHTFNIQSMDTTIQQDKSGTFGTCASVKVAFTSSVGCQHDRWKHRICATSAVASSKVRYCMCQTTGTFHCLHMAAQLSHMSLSQNVMIHQFYMLFWILKHIMDKCETRILWLQQLRGTNMLAIIIIRHETKYF